MEAEAREAAAVAERAAEEGTVRCRMKDCPEPARHGVGSKSPRWRDLCDGHYQEQLDKAQRAANDTVERRQAGELGPPRNGASAKKAERETERKRTEARVSVEEITGMRSKLAARLALVAGRLDVIEAEMAILREQAKPLEDEMDEVLTELGNVERMR